MKINNDPTDTRRTRLMKNFIKNEFLFATFLSDTPPFLNRLIGISIRFFPEGAKARFSREEDIDTYKAFQHRAEINKLCTEIVDTLPQERKMDFYMSMHKILSDFHLGKEWLSTLVCYVVSGFRVPPVFNLAISQEVVMPTRAELQAKGRKQWVRKARVTLILNPDTSLTDIQDAWDEIRSFQKESWPDFKSIVFGPQMIIRYAEVKKAMVAKHDLSNDEKYAGLPSEYEVLLAKKFKDSPEEARKAILQSRRAKGQKSERVKIKKKLTDIELVKQQGFKGAAAVREAARIRKRRQRNKKVTPSLH